MEWGISILDISIESDYSIFCLREVQEAVRGYGSSTAATDYVAGIFAAGAFAKAIGNVSNLPNTTSAVAAPYAEFKARGQKSRSPHQHSKSSEKHPCGKGNCRLVQGLWGKNVADHADSRISIHGQRGVISHCRRGPGWWVKLGRCDGGRGDLFISRSQVKLAESRTLYMTQYKYVKTQLFDGISRAFSRRLRLAF